MECGGVQGRPSIVVLAFFSFLSCSISRNLRSASLFARELCCAWKPSSSSSCSLLRDSGVKGMCVSSAPLRSAPHLLSCLPVGRSPRSSAP